MYELIDRSLNINPVCCHFASVGISYFNVSTRFHKIILLFVVLLPHTSYYGPFGILIKVITLE